jgi:hypothetical protein
MHPAQDPHDHELTAAESRRPEPQVMVGEGGLA